LAGFEASPVRRRGITQRPARSKPLISAIPNREVGRR